jgi:hypothetical protein
MARYTETHFRAIFRILCKCHVSIVMFKNTIYQNIQVPISLKRNSSFPLQVKFCIRIYVKFPVKFLAFYVLYP